MEAACRSIGTSSVTTLSADKPILSGEGNLFIQTTKVEKVEGEAYVNVRKGKSYSATRLASPWAGPARPKMSPATRS
ncbi:hypothetical protein RJ639_042739 [Escallonia herrerae]|uniref:Activator of Hsp90 ATPase AHSA1-like N-terminal domain-containing protein n=1 Tax=Escallonia herrerae TaxID=1293975 RepID=A0AA89B041_9ASTE|nr:hypothetical protein RJ639_042739 [Escallonia herrerae]